MVYTNCLHSPCTLKRLCLGESNSVYRVVGDNGKFVETVTVEFDIRPGRRPFPYKSPGHESPNTQTQLRNNDAFGLWAYMHHRENNMHPIISVFLTSFARVSTRVFSLLQSHQERPSPELWNSNGTTRHHDCLLRDLMMQTIAVVQVLTAIMANEGFAPMQNISQEPLHGIEEELCRCIAILETVLHRDGKPLMSQLPCYDMKI